MDKIAIHMIKCVGIEVFGGCFSEKDVVLLMHYVLAQNIQVYAPSIVNFLLFVVSFCYLYNKYSSTSEEDVLNAYSIVCFEKDCHVRQCRSILHDVASK